MMLKMIPVMLVFGLFAGPTLGVEEPAVVTCAFDK